MTNDDLDRLTELAYEVQTGLPTDLMLDGRGNFRLANGTIVSPSELLARVTKAADSAAALRNMLAAAPRRKVSKKA